MLKINIINCDDAITTSWAGGESRQYYIYPPDSTYAARNFFCRLSMATSNSDAESKYTNLENLTRYLVMLDGDAHVYHKDKYDIVMTPYNEIDVFDGGWESYATGKVTDFNMMLSNNCRGKMSIVDRDMLIKANIDLVFNNSLSIIAFFCKDGDASFKLNTGEQFNIAKYELIMFEGVTKDFEAYLKLGNVKLIRMDINLTL